MPSFFGSRKEKVLLIENDKNVFFRNYINLVFALKNKGSRETQESRGKVHSPVQGAKDTHRYCWPGL